MDSVDATFNVASTGVHTVNVWMREDGFVFDKIVLTTNASYTPTGNGPAESSRSGGSAPAQATSPSPANSATGVSITTDLSWTAGSGATSHDVYFGTSSPGASQGNQTAATFDTGTMANDTTYYWRIDEVNAQGTTTGNVWSFTTIVTAPSQASNPSPADSATDVSITHDLSWSAGSGATSHDVYFGTSSPGDFQGNQTETTFDPGSLSYNITYYWRIDEVNAAGTTTGTVWNFTTEAQPQPPGQATNPDPADSATDVNVETDLSWTAGTGSTSSDVYFGTTSPGTFQGNQTATTYDPGTMDNDTTYYWRIDEVNANGTTTGNVWSFTTAEGGQPVTEEFGDAVDTNHPGTIEDTFTKAGSGGDDNWSTYLTLNTYTWPADTIANTTIIKWDLTDIPTDANVTEATLYLYQVETGGDTSYDIGVHKIINVDPNISTCTWNTYDGTNSWTGGADGGQGDIATAEDNQSVNSTNNAYKTWTVTNMVQAWVSTPSSNYGMLVNSDAVASVDSYRFFASTEDSNNAIRPKLIVTYYTGAAPPGQATNPSPADSATDVSITADLSWTAGNGSTSSDVYFGTSSPGSFQGNQTAATYDPGTMANDTTYYWRIDEVNAQGTTTGNVWNFTTIVVAPGQASGPSPADSATNVAVDTDLSWTAGSGATSHDVYFGTSSPGASQGNQTATTFDTGTMSNNTTYYWRIDEVNAAGTTTGNVWSFTTESEGGEPIEFDSVSSNAEKGYSTTLSWSQTVGTGSDRILIVGIAGEDSSESDLVISSVTYGSENMTLVSGSSATGGSGAFKIKTELYYLLNPDSGTDTVTVTYSGNTASRAGGAVSLLNVAQQAAEAVSTNANESTNTISTNITTQTDGAWVVDVVGCGNSGSFTTTASGMVERFDETTTDSSGAGSTKSVASAGSTTMSWEHTGANRMALSVAAFAPAD